MATLSPNWSDLEKGLTDRLLEYQKTRPNDLKYRGPYQSILEKTKDGEKCTDGFRSDGLLKNDKFLLAIEVEAGQTHSDTNVGKYWLIQTQHKFEKIVLFHIYTPKHNSYPNRKKLAKFYAEKMKNEGIPLEYIPITYTAGDAPEYQDVLDNVWKLVSEKITSLFPHED